jgi:hypothetical protein
MMTSFRSTSSAVLTTLLLGVTTAQGPDDRRTSNVEPSAPPATQALSVGPAANLEKERTRFDWMVPIHTAAPDTIGGSYGLWAAGPDYKASFHDGFAFFPVLGADHPENLPLHWRTAGVVAGGVPVDLATEVEPTHDAWRVEYQRGPMTEAYDLREDGVEQSFVFPAPVGAAGDLVIRGVVTTPLRARPLEAAHAALTFCDGAGREILRYGAAIAFDAVGRKTEVATSWTGQLIELRVPAEWLAGAVHPVTVDPLTSRVVVANWGGSDFGQPSYPDIVRNDETDELYVTYTRQTSASDYDLYVRVTDDLFGGTRRIFSDITASWSTPCSQIAYVGGSNRFVVALMREANTWSRVRFYVHDQGNTTENSGTLLYIDGGPTLQDSSPTIGGTWGGASGTRAFAAFRRDTSATPANTSDSEVWGVMVDLGTVSPAVFPSLGTPFAISSTGPNMDSEAPCATQFSGGGTASWILVWQQYDHGIANDDWDVLAARIDYDGSIDGSGFFGQAYLPEHKIRPKVAGMGGRFLVAYIEAPNSGFTTSSWGQKVWVQRFDWSESATGPTKHAESLIASTAGSLTFGTYNRPIAYDDSTDSHWAVAWYTSAWDVLVARVGHHGWLAEVGLAYSGPGDGYLPALTFNNDDREFPMVWVTNENAPAGQPIYGARLRYRDARAIGYGSSCAGTLSGTNRGGDTGPHKGSEYYALRLAGGRGSAPTVLLASFGSADQPLPFRRAIACRLLLATGGPLIDVASGPSDAAGSFGATISISERVPDASIFWQTVQLDGGYLWSSTGLELVIR